MDERISRNGQRNGSVKAAINMYGGGKINQVTNTVKKSQNHASATDTQNKASKAQELHLAKNRVNQITENRISAESEKSQAEFELQKAKTFVRELTSQIELSKSRVKEFRKGDSIVEQTAQEENDQYEKVAREVEVVKRELSKIKLEIASAVEETDRAKKEVEAAGLRLKSYTRKAENLRREIDEANEEEVLVELARIQARKELAEIEAQRKEERERYLVLIEETSNKIGVLRDEVEKMKDLEDTLALTNLDVEVLQSELNLIKQMDSKFQRSEKLKNSALLLATKELEAARKELEIKQKQTIQLMSSMDVIRIKIKSILKEKDEMEKKEAKTEKSMKKLNSKLLIAKDKLEVTRKSEQTAKSMLPSFFVTLQNLETEKEAAKKEEKKLKEETEKIRADIQKIESETDRNEDKLEAVIEELEAVQKAEEIALEKLKAVVGNTVRARASKTKSTITISKFEYDYLNEHAAKAQDIADKKVAAAHACEEALKADEREMKLKIAQAERVIEELKLKEEQEVHRMEQYEKEAELTKEELQKRRCQENKCVQQRRFMKERDYSSTPARQAKFRRSVGSPATRRMSTSTSLTMKRRRQVMLKIGKYFANEQIESEKSVTENENSITFKGDGNN